MKECYYIQISEGILLHTNYSEGMLLLISEGMLLHTN